MDLALKIDKTLPKPTRHLAGRGYDWRASIAIFFPKREIELCCRKYKGVSPILAQNGATFFGGEKLL